MICPGEIGSAEVAQARYVRQRTEIFDATVQSHWQYMSCRLGSFFPPTEKSAMPALPDALRNIYSRLTVMTPVRKGVALVVGMSLLATLGACSNVSALTKERVAQSDASVQQAQQAVGRSEAGAIELQQARDKLNDAKIALGKDRQQEAERAAAQAHLYAELALAKAQSANARKAADEVLASLETLRSETERSSPTPR